MTVISAPHYGPSTKPICDLGICATTALVLSSRNIPVSTFLGVAAVSPDRTGWRCGDSFFGVAQFIAASLAGVVLTPQLKCDSRRIVAAQTITSHTRLPNLLRSK